MSESRLYVHSEENGDGNSHPRPLQSSPFDIEISQRESHLTFN